MNRKNNFDEMLEHALKQEPSFNLRPDFSERVINQMTHNRAVEERHRNYIYALSIFAFLCTSIICLIVFLDINTLYQIMDFSGWGILTGILIIGIQYLDKKLVRRRTHLT